MRYGMMIELDKCIGCMACVSVCKERWDSGPDAARDWVRTYEHGTRGRDLGITFYPGLCNQCAEHPCTIDCPTNATYVDERTGIVVVDREVCIGCGNCVSMCPYGARSPDPEQEIVEKCNLCLPYVEQGGWPACVTTCLSQCRHFGDLDDPTSDASKMIRARQAAPLVTPEVQIGPKVYYAPADKREQLLQAGVVGRARTTAFTTTWQQVTRPVARYAVPGLAVATVVGGVLANVVSRRQRLGEARAGEAERAAAPVEQEQSGPVDETAAGAEALLPRHRLGLRLLHWINAASWIALLVTGTALMIAPSFALFGTGFPRWLSDLVGGQPTLMKLHVVWGLAWAAIIVPFFLLLKRGGIEALLEIRLTRDDLRWLARKPLVLFGLRQGPLPPQDKYNAGQKVFALSALAGTTIIIASGLVLTFHLGSSDVVLWAILVHKLAIMLALLGLAVHITMAAIIVEERPALRSMVTGSVAREHAESHSSRWVTELEGHEPGAADASPPDGTAAPRDTDDDRTTDEVKR